MSTGQLPSQAGLVLPHRREKMRNGNEFTEKQLLYQARRQKMGRITLVTRDDTI